MAPRIVETMPLLRLAPSRALKEKRLAALLGGRDERDAALAEAVRGAQVAGSLALSGCPAADGEPGLRAFEVFELSGPRK